MTAARKNPNHRISQNRRRVDEAASEIAAEAAERDVVVLNTAKAYTDQQVTPLADRVLNLEVAELMRRAKEEAAYEDRCVPHIHKP